MKVIIEDTKLTNIADSLRNKLDTDEEFTPDDMADAIDNMSTGADGQYISFVKSEGSDVIDTAVYNGFEEIESTDMVESKENIVVGDGTLSVKISKYSSATGAYTGVIKKIVLPSSLESINNSAFQYLKGLTEINIPDSVVSVGAKAFDHCSSLESISFPDTVTRLEKSVLGFTNINEFYIHNTVTYIGENAFQKTPLKRIFIPSTVTTISTLRNTDAPFLNCNNLEIYTDAPSKPSGWGLYFNNVDYSALTVHYGVSREEYNEIIESEDA